MRNGSIYFSYLQVILILLFAENTKTTAQPSIDVIDSVSVITYRIKGKTATGHNTYKVREPFVAVSRDLIKKYPLHSYITLKNCRWQGTYKVLDLMNSRHQKTVDVFYRKRGRFNKVNCVCTKNED